MMQPTPTRPATLAQMWYPATEWLASLPASECWQAVANCARNVQREIERGDPFGDAYCWARNAATWARLAQTRD